MTFSSVRQNRQLPWVCLLFSWVVAGSQLLSPDAIAQDATLRDPIAAMQAKAAATNQPDWVHWGPTAGKYSSWSTHTNRLVPVYTFGLNLNSVRGENSVYRSESRLKNVYGFLPTNSVNPQAEYFDQTDIYRLQREAIAAGKKRVILFILDGMDWQTTRAAAIAKTASVSYDCGRGQGLAFQDYRGTETDFGAMVTSPHNDGTNVDVDQQIVSNPGGSTSGGFNASRCGDTPWAEFTDPQYPIAASESDKHAFTDSSSAAASMTCGIKTYNNGVNVDTYGREVVPIARELQQEGFAVGVVTSVPISHATPAAAYANNVHRNDYQDLTRDMLGRPSVFHPGGLPGLDVLIGAGWGVSAENDGSQGKNFVPGNQYLTTDDLAAIDHTQGGNYVVAQRTPGEVGSDVLDTAVKTAIARQQRLFGYFGVAGGHLPFRTADGGYDPVDSVGNPELAKAEQYSDSDVSENVSLGQMTIAALDVLNAKSDRWWLMIEAGDVDWANHGNNLDNSIGAVLSGEEAFENLTSWVENHGGWDDTCVILTADHGHYLVLDKPDGLARAASKCQRYND